jgi:hypothetical protein
MRFWKGNEKKVRRILKMREIEPAKDRVRLPRHHTLHTRASHVDFMGRIEFTLHVRREGDARAQT